MTHNGLSSDPREIAAYQHNRRRIPQEELLKCSGLYVAFSLDGTRILASGKTMEDVDAQLLAVGIHPRDAVGGYIDPPELVNLPSLRLG